jgi:hypothetical protein
MDGERISHLPANFSLRGLHSPCGAAKRNLSDGSNSIPPQLNNDRFASAEFVDWTGSGNFLVASLFEFIDSLLGCHHGKPVFLVRGRLS